MKKIKISDPINYVMDNKSSNISLGSAMRVVNLVDAVFAIAMTLLVFDLKETDVHSLLNGSVDLFGYLTLNWVPFVSFLMNFLVLAQLWVSHVSQSKYLRLTDHSIVWENIFFLLCVSMVPFTAWMFGLDPFNKNILVLYGLNIFFAWFFDYLIWKHLVANQRRISSVNISDRSIRFGFMTSYFNLAWYIISLLLVAVSPVIALVGFITAPIPFIMGAVYWLKKS